ncbi:MAG: flagellin [Peptococcaceae bacterium]|jgi:flagellin|nr:flagellin [Peptococcaceae bacterium]
MRIQHNVMAMNAYRNYSNNTSALSKNLEKLSSGYKINRAGDDAAGLAISEKMRAQITGLEAAQKNVKDGISLVNTAEGALQEVQDMMNRMVYLAQESANGTFDNPVDRKALQAEVDQLRDEIDRIADSANFNGIKLLDGSLGGGKISADGATFVGANISEFSAAKITGATGAGKGDLSQNATDSATAIDTFTVDGQTLKIDWTKGDAKKLHDKIAVDQQNTSQEGLEGLAEDLTKLFNDEMKAQGLTGEVKVTVDAAGTFSLESTNESSTGSVGWTGSSLADADGAKSLGTQLFSATPGTGGVVEAGKTVSTAFANGDSFNMTINGTTVQVKLSAAIAKNSTLSQVATQLQTDIRTAIGAYNTAKYGSATPADKNALTASDFTVEADPSGGLKVVYGGKQDVEFSFSESDAGATGKPGKTAGLLGLAGGTSKSGGAGGLTLQIGDSSDSYNQLNVNIKDMHVYAMGIANISIANQSGAQAAVDVIKNAINYVSEVRGNLGAISNRLDHTKNNLGVMRENITDAESSIRDTDVADEMMAYTKNNILVQSAQAMLAQANQVPQGVLQLLQ